MNLPPAPPFFVFPVPFLDCEDLQTCAGFIGLNPKPCTLNTSSFQKRTVCSCLLGLLPDGCSIVNQTEFSSVVLAAMLSIVL